MASKNFRSKRVFLFFFLVSTGIHPIHLLVRMFTLQFGRKWEIARDWARDREKYTDDHKRHRPNFLRWIWFDSVFSCSIHNSANFSIDVFFSSFCRMKLIQFLTITITLRYRNVIPNNNEKWEEMKEERQRERGGAVWKRFERKVQLCRDKVGI